ncbi:MAG TPA: cupredoxin domain-containing protein [Candidatus Baltobacteraceae bacterium]|jgi:cytochrome c oxidase subunit 2|nr:cupredoxin domain-containing protein [Candidatus Baltobacteraceae bacterium]
MTLRLILALGILLLSRQLVLAEPPINVAVSNWKFAPALVEAHVGETITLRLKSSEGVHGVFSGDLGIPKTMILPGKVVEVSFTPKKAGTYQVHCSIPCGEGHDKMFFIVKVDPQ